MNQESKELENIPEVNAIPLQEGDIVIEKGQFGQFKEQFNYIKDNAMELLTGHFSKQEREEIQEKTGLSLSMIRKILMRSRIKVLSVNGKPYTEEELETSK